MEAPPRESMIQIAIDFLNNPRVQSSTLQQKIRFLRKKGLSDEEIQIACERVHIFEQPTNISMPGTLQIPQTRLEKLKDFLFNSAFVGSILYAAYLFYKRFIEPFLFGRKKKKSIDEKLDELNKNVKTQINTQQDDREKNKVFTVAVSRELHNLKSDLESVKGLLLSKDQFAHPDQFPATSSSIPSWQLKQTDHDESKNEMDAGSNSSETEIVTKNSDSSIEMM